MRKVLVVLLALAAFFPLAALPRVAVLDIAAQPGIDASVVVPVTETIMEEVVGARAYVVLDRAYVEQVVKEMEFELSGLVGDTQATKAGQFLGADYVVTGKVQLIGEAYFLVAKMIEVRTGVIVSQASEQGEGKLSNLLGMARTVGRKLVSGAPVAALEPAPAAQAGAAPQAGSATVPLPGAGRRIRAGFVMPFSMKDRNIADVAAIERVRERNAAWLELRTVDQLRFEELPATLDRLAEAEGCDIVISCDWGYAEEMRRAAERHPRTVFWSAGGPWDPKAPPNFGVFGLNELPHFYLQGLVAGSLSAKGKVGALWEELHPGEPWRRLALNNFALGVRAANPKAQILVRFLPLNHWDRPEADTEAARALVAKGCDFLWGAVSPQTATTLEALGLSGSKVRCFQNDFSYAIAPSVVVSGPLHDYAVLYERGILALRDGTWKSEEVYLPESVSFGGGGEERFNPAFLAELQSKRVKTPDRGSLPLLQVLSFRGTELREDRFQPLTGPVKDQKGSLRLKAGERPEWRYIEAMDWLVEGILVQAGK